MNRAAAEIMLSSEIIRASAGTGKTFQLSNRYIGLLAREVKAEQILATTFTRKAAGEIQSRILDRLARAAEGDRGTLKELIEHVDPQMTAAKARRLLVRVVRELHRVQICTLDSFYARIAGSYCFELGLPPDWSIARETEDSALRREAITRVLNEESPQRVIDLMRLLNPGEARRPVYAQIRAVVDGLYQIFQLQPDRSAWDGLNAPTPLNEGEVTASVECLAALDDWPANKLVRNGARQDLERARARDWPKFLSGGLAGKLAAGQETYQRWPIPREVCEAYRPLIDHGRAVVLGRVTKQTRAMWELLEAFDRRYRELKFLRRMLCFEDVTLGLAHGGIEGRLEEVYYRLDGRIGHLLLDEFQDTSLSQWQVIRPLAGEIVQDAAGGRMFFCVGDVKQAIYGWRGGVSEIFEELTQRWPHIPQNSMARTWRCTQPVVDAVNRVFQSLDGNPALRDHAAAVEQWSAAFEAHETANADPGCVRLRVGPGAADEQKQSDVVLAEGSRVVRGVLEEAPRASIGVLVRTNKAVARVIFELRQLGIEASEEGGVPLNDSPGVSLLLSLLRLSDHPGDTVARFHVASSPLGKGVGLTRHEDHQAAWRLAAQVRQRLMREGYGATVQGWAEVLAGHCDARALRRLMQLVELAHRHDLRPTLRPMDFVRMAEDERVPDPTAAQVCVMTTHQAKGLEFDVVVLPELDGRLGGYGRNQVLLHRPTPTSPPDMICRYADQTVRALDTRGRMQLMSEQDRMQRIREELSVLYVMMTRARYALHMILAPSKDNERTIPATCAGILRCALAEGCRAEAGAVPYEHGDARWFEKVRWKGEAGVSADDVGVPRLAPNERRRRVWTSPSALADARRIDLARHMSLDGEGARERGLSVHEMLQEVEWFDPAAEYPQPLKDAFAHEDLRQLMSRASYAAGAQVEVLREEPFVVVLDEQIVRGAIDRLILVRRDERVECAEVIDFKTDAVRPADAARVQELVEAYRPQVAAYRAAVAKMYGLPESRVTVKLALLSAGRVCEL